MRAETLLRDLALHELLESLLPDFVLAFTFFTALTYAILSKRFDRQRPAIAMSAALGLALAVGLVWWEQDRGLSIRHLGPVAVGFAVILLGMVLYQAIRQAGGSWAGAGIALGASILVARILEVDWPVDPQVVQTVTMVALMAGAFAFLLHRRALPSLARRLSAPASRERAAIRHDMTDLHRDRRVGKGLRRELKRVRRRADSLRERPQEARKIMLQLRRVLPAEGWLTQQLAQLRAKAHRIGQGHVARIEEIRQAIAGLPPAARKQASDELIARSRQLRLDRRIERLDKAVAANEATVRQLTRQAQQALADRDPQRLTVLLKDAEKLQKHNTGLLRTIQRTEQRLADMAGQVAQEAQRGSRQ